MNLIKWLSKCENSLLESKEKTQLYGGDDDVRNLKASNKIMKAIKTEWKRR